MNCCTTVRKLLKPRKKNAQGKWVFVLQQKKPELNSRKQSDLFKFPFSKILLRITRSLDSAYLTQPWCHPRHTCWGWSPCPVSKHSEPGWEEGTFGILLGWALKGCRHLFSEGASVSDEQLDVDSFCSGWKGHSWQYKIEYRSLQVKSGPPPVSLQPVS